MYIVVITRNRLVANPYWNPSLSNLEPAQLEEQYTEVRYAESDKTLTFIINDLHKQNYTKVEYYNAYQIFPKLVTTVSLELQQ